MGRESTTVPHLTAYTCDADKYDERTAAFQHWREHAVDVLPLTPGDSVVDVGCGTGLCFEPLERAIGPAGQIVGIDSSVDMLALARRRAEGRGWSNIDLIAAPAHHANLPAHADAALFCAVHDVLQDPASLHNVLEQLHPGSWVSAVGGRWAPAYLVAFNMLIHSLHAPYIRDFRGFDRPWARLSSLLQDARVAELAGGAGFCLLGHTPSHDDAGPGSGSGCVRGLPGRRRP